VRAHQRPDPGLDGPLTLNCETDGGGEDLAGAIAESLRAVTHLRGEVALVAPGTLANDGKVIDDVRSYE
jgi:phenylacetate-CoA ligase